MENRELLTELLVEVLGEYKEYRKQNEIAFFCPVCKHYKKKLQINIVTGRWHCWVCQVDNGMAGNSIFTLFKKLGISYEYYARLSSLLGTTYSPPKEQIDIPTESIELPYEFISMLNTSNSPHFKNAMYYLKKRGIIPEDILKYNIGYAEYGRYKGKVIIPSYDASGKLNFFTARAYYADDPIKHITPAWDKNIVGFELFVNWEEPIILVEGAFDAMAVKRNAIPLFGKTISELLHHRIVENNVRNIYIALDRDALANSLRYSSMFIGEGRNAYIVDLVDKDPSNVGFYTMLELIQGTKKMTLKETIRLKLQCN